MHKAGIKSVATNYRPISLISNLAKVFEKILKNRLLIFLEENIILSKRQLGFRNNKSTRNCLYIHIYSILYTYKHLDDKKSVIGVFLDLAKAFDTVDQKILLEKARKIGIRGVANNLIKSYITDI